MNKNETLLREGSFPQLLLNLSIPAIVIMVVMVLYNMADVFFIGKLQDPYMIAAVGLAGPVFSILSGLGTLFGSGGCTVISLALGEGNHARVRQVSALCFYGSILLGIVFAAVVLLFLEPVCRLIGADENTIEYTMDYLRIIMLFAPISIFSNVFLNLIRGDGAAKESMIANVLGTAMNIALDPLFILVFHWGVAGAAVATGVGNCTSAAYLLWYMYRNRAQYSVMWLSLLISQRKVRDMGQRERYNEAMKRKSEGTGHGEEGAVSSGDFYERVWHGRKMPGVSGKAAVASRFCLSEMRLPPRLSAVQWPVPMCRVSPPDLSNSGNGSSQDPYAAETVVSGILLCQPG